MAVPSTAAGTITLAVLAAATTPAAARRLRAPGPLVQLAAGLAAAAVFPRLTADASADPTIEAALGHARTALGLLVVFSAGLSLPLGHLRARGRAIAGAALAKLLPPLVAVAATAAGLGFAGPRGAAIAALALSEISVAIGWSMLAAHGRLHTGEGRDLIAMTFVANSLVVVGGLLVLLDPSAGITVVVFVAGTLMHERLPRRVEAAFRATMAWALVPAFFVLAGARVEWSALGASWHWLPLLGAAALARAPVPPLGASRRLGIDPARGRYLDALCLGRLTFALLVLDVGRRAGVLDAAQLSQLTVVAALLAVAATGLAAAVHRPDRAPPVEPPTTERS